MAKDWDNGQVSLNVDCWRECLRVLKPGAHLLAFGGTRTYHRLASSIEDAGFEIRDSIMSIGSLTGPLVWCYGSGFPKSHNLKGEWSGWGTALKPAHEPIVVARKPLIGTIAQNVLEHGTGALNIDGCRVHTAGSEARDYTVKRLKPGATLNKTGGNWRPEDGIEYSGATKAGRWPANLILSHTPECQQVGTTTVKGDQRETGDGTRPGGFGNVGSDSGDGVPNARVYGNETVEAWECSENCPVQAMDRQSGNRKSGTMRAGQQRKKSQGLGGYHDGFPNTATLQDTHGDEGGASRYFPVFKYNAKAASKERILPDGTRSSHPTMKPIALMQWLARLVTPPGGTVLDPFGGSGTTAIACVKEGFKCILIEKDPEYLKIIQARIAGIGPIQRGLFDEEAS